MGEVFKPEGERKVVGANVTVLLFEFGILAKSKGYLYWGGEFQRSRYLNMIGKAEPFLTICKNLLEKFSSRNRNVIFVAERIKLIENLFNQLSTVNKSKFIGSAKNDQLSYQVVFATPGKIRDGVDAADRDCLIMTSPIGNIEQMVGRTEREYEGKKDVIIVDMVDLAFSRIKSTLHNRVKFYERKNWNIKYIYILKDGSKKELSKKEATEIVKE